MEFEKVLLEFSTEKERQEAIERYSEKLEQLKKKHDSLKNLKNNKTNRKKLEKEMGRYKSMIAFAQRR